MTDKCSNATGALHAAGRGGAGAEEEVQVVTDYICDYAASCQSQLYDAGCKGTVAHKPVDIVDDAGGVSTCTNLRFCRRGQEWVQCVPVEKTT